MSNQTFTWFMAGLVAVFFLVTFLVNYKLMPWQTVPRPETGDRLVRVEQEIDRSRKSVATKPIPADRIWIGGIPRPKTDMMDGTSRQAHQYPNPLEQVGKVARVDTQKNKSTQLIAEASLSGENPERLSLFAKPKPFDLSEFELDPSAYLENIEPGRIMQTAKISPNIDPIKRDGKYFSAMLQGETVTLKAKVKPFMPVTFYSPHVGHFQNSLSTVTVQADSSGTAEAQYTAAKGTVGDVDILASSPVHSHQARFLLRVEIPKALPILK